MRHAAAAFAVAVLAAVGVAADAPKAKHPHFDDGGTLSWSTKLADAQAAAKASDKLIFIEYGREA
jgi:hypothetical protein